MLFAHGERPSAADIARKLAQPATAGLPGARVIHAPTDEGRGWVELLAAGLTFELSGLAPARGAAPPAEGRRYGLSSEMMANGLEAVALFPGEHVSSAAGSVPLVRVMAGLAARLAQLDKARAICWAPAQTWMEPGYFVRTVSAWLGGGAFPALGLTSLERTADGGVESRGLAFFIGQELRLEAREGEDAATTVKLAVRLIDALVRDGRVDETGTLQGPDGEILTVEPSDDGRLLRVWRQG